MKYSKIRETNIISPGENSVNLTKWKP